MKVRPSFAALAVTLFHAPAAAEIPAPVQAMIDAAIAGGSESEIAAVIKYAAKANPDHEKEILAILAARRAAKRAEEKERLENAGLLEIWSGRGEIGASRSTGNTDSLGLFASLNLARDGLSWRHEVRAEADLQESGGVTTRERYLAAYQPHYKVSDRMSAYGLLQYERDTLLGYDTRYVASGGIGYALVRQPDLSVGLQGGPAFRRAELTSGTIEESLAARAALDARWKLTPTLSIKQDASAIVESDSSTLISTTGLETRLIGALTARASYNVHYESNPPPGRDPLDTLSRVTLVYAF